MGWKGCGAAGAGAIAGGAGGAGGFGYSLSETVAGWRDWRNFISTRLLNGCCGVHLMSRRRIISISCYGITKRCRRRCGSSAVSSEEFSGSDKDTASSPKDGGGGRSAGGEELSNGAGGGGKSLDSSDSPNEGTGGKSAGGSVVISSGEEISGNSLDCSSEDTSSPKLGGGGRSGAKSSDAEESGICGKEGDGVSLCSSSMTGGSGVG